MNGLALAIVRHRKLKKQSQTEAAEILGFTQTKLSRMELGHSKPYKDIPVLAKWLGISESRALHLLEAPAGADKDFMEIVEEVREVQQSQADFQEEMAGQIADVAAMLRELVAMDRAPVNGVVADAIVAQRMARQWTLHELAMLFQVSPQTMLRIEQGVAALEVYAPQIADFLGVPLPLLRQAFDAEGDEFKSAVADEMAAWRDVRADDYEASGRAVENFEAMLEALDSGLPGGEREKGENGASTTT